MPKYDVAGKRFKDGNAIKKQVVAKDEKQAALFFELDYKAVARIIVEIKELTPPQ
jgi:outer membrane lipopolysaccharide assembly protein LptE/RlpB